MDSTMRSEGRLSFKAQAEPLRSEQHLDYSPPSNANAGGLLRGERRLGSKRLHCG
jgi:hypothetical protein